MSSIYLPGRGMVNLAAARVSAVLSQYDDRLVYHPCSPATGQPTVFIKMGADWEEEGTVSIDGTNVFPILAFAHEPEPEYALQQIIERDSLRNGTKLLDDLHAHNEALKEEKREKAAEADAIAAEAYEWAARQIGTTEHKRVYMTDRRKRKRGF